METGKDAFLLKMNKAKERFEKFEDLIEQWSRMSENT
jgi:hypothetical protein